LHNLKSDTAILLFAHAAGEEVRYKTFSDQHDVKVNKKIARAMLRYAIVVAQRAGMPLVPILSDRQCGSTFGERLANAFQEVFAAGFQRVICIGSDCPALSVSDLVRAREELRTANMVVGPATDGGAYLIGLHIDSFQLDSFAMLNWQTDELLNELMLYSFRQQSCLGCVSLLEEKADVDNSVDLKQQLQELPVYHTLRRQLNAILQSGIGLPVSRRVLFKPVQRHVRALQRRAPPVYC
jgi:glycosyltransferase A (GT-A) superfamily protein (DUF2064 family)